MIVAVKENSTIVIKLVTFGIEYSSLGLEQTYFKVGIRHFLSCVPVPRGDL